MIQKYHKIKFSSLYHAEFMLFALICVLIILTITLNSNQSQKQKLKLSWSGLISGILNGAANYVVLFLSAIENASVLFPVISVANITIVWLIGIVFFKEKLTILQTIGLILGILSIVLLKL